jgi:hypothetical protein
MLLATDMFEQGRPLTLQEHAIFKPYFAQNVLNEARIIDGRVPFWLRSDMCAVVLGNRIFFRTGYYQANTSQGTSLLGHELMHVAQYLHGMTIFKYVWSCRKGYMQSPYEVQAYDMGARIAADFANKFRN